MQGILLREGSDGAKLYPLTDGLGSTVALTDAAGSVTHRYRYDAYGAPHASASASSSASNFRFLFTGREWLGLAGLQDNRYRVYSAALGRWLQVDPIGFHSLDINLFRYCLSSPTRFSDPSGAVVQVCSRDIEVNPILNFLASLVGAKHMFIRTDTKAAGMGPATGGPLPACPIGVPTAINDHAADVANSNCVTVPGVNENCVNSLLDVGRPTGVWSPSNNCNSFVSNILSLCGGGI